MFWTYHSTENWAICKDCSYFLILQNFHTVIFVLFSNCYTTIRFLDSLKFIKCHCHYHNQCTTLKTTAQTILYITCCQTSNISHTKYQILYVSHLILQFSLPNPLNWSQVLSPELSCSWSRLIADSPNTSEWSTILLPTKVWLIL